MCSNKDLWAQEQTRSDIFDYIEILYNVSVGIVRAIRCHRRNIKGNIINDSAVSELPVVFQISYFY